MKRLITLALVAALTACGGGGGANAPETVPAPSSPVQATQPLAAASATAEVPLQAPTMTNPNCSYNGWFTQCDLIVGQSGVGTPPGSYVKFTNNTGVPLQVDKVQTYSGETTYWSEYCVAVVWTDDQSITGQYLPGIGEANCKHKEPGENYMPLVWGDWSGLLVQPGQSLIVGTHTEPNSINHTHELQVRYAQTALYSWRQPQYDKVFNCDGTTQATVWTAFKNTTNRTMAMQGAEVYAVSGKASAPDTTDQACAYVLDVNGNVRWSQCGLNKRGSYSWSAVYFEPGESVVAQAINTCNAPALWDYVAWLRVW